MFGALFNGTINPQLPHMMRQQRRGPVVLQKKLERTLRVDRRQIKLLLIVQAAQLNIQMQMMDQLL